SNIEQHTDRESRKAIYDVAEGPLVRIREIEFDGPVAIPARTFLGFGKHLTSVMELHGKFLFFRGSEYSERKLRQDLVQLRKLYRSDGYRDAVVDLLPPKFSADGTAVEISILVEEGPLYRVASIDITGVHAFPKEEILSKIKLKPGDPYTYEAVIRDFRALQRFYGETGAATNPSRADRCQFKLPPEGRRETFHENENGTEAVVDVVYEITENSPKYIRDVLITGNRLTQDRVIRRELTFNPGELANQPKIEQSIQRLDALQYLHNDGAPPACRHL